MFKELKLIQKYETPIKDSRYHKQYVEGFVDYYVGITLPDLRKLSKRFYRTVSTHELNQLLHSKIHEYRLFALILLVDKYNKADLSERKEIVDYYIKNIKYVNNWDLVDASAYYILGAYYYQINDYTKLYEFSESDDLWVKRISIIATNYLIRQNVFHVTIDIVDYLLEDKHDLIHKANGWMLRNIGDRDRQLLTNYIKTNYHRMPRTTLRYAIEHYEEKTRKRILKGDIQ